MHILAFKKVKSCVGAALISDSRPSAARPQTRGQTVLQCAHLFPSFRQQQFIPHVDRGTWMSTTCLELLPDGGSARNRTNDHFIQSPMPYCYSTKSPITHTKHYKTKNLYRTCIQLKKTGVLYDNLRLSQCHNNINSKNNSQVTHLFSIFSTYMRIR